MIAVYFFSPKVQEVRNQKKFKGLNSLKNIFLHETKSVLIEETHQIMNIKKYME